METYPNHREPSIALYSSFVLRCWRGEDARLRARLIEVPSGISHTLADLKELSGLLQSLLEKRCETQAVAQNEGSSLAHAPEESPGNGERSAP